MLLFFHLNPIIMKLNSVCSRNKLPWLYVVMIICLYNSQLSPLTIPISSVPKAYNFHLKKKKVHQQLPAYHFCRSPSQLEKDGGCPIERITGLLEGTVFLIPISRRLGTNNDSNQENYKENFRPLISFRDPVFGFVSYWKSRPFRGSSSQQECFLMHRPHLKLASFLHQPKVKILFVVIWCCNLT